MTRRDIRIVPTRRSLGTMHLHHFIFVAIVIAIPAAHPPVYTPVSHEITMAADSYRPTELTVARGDTIVWFNTDIVTHTATSRGGFWDSGRLKRGKRFRWVAVSSGRYPYVCSTHRGMRGTIVVR